MDRGPNRVRRGLRRQAGNALRSRGWDRAGTHQPVVGVVEEFTRVVIVGWVAVPVGAPPVRLSLMVNRTEVATAWAVPTDNRVADGEVREFRFKVRGLWAYLRTSQRITVQLGGVPLPIAGYGTSVAPPADGRLRLSLFKTRRAKGWVFSQTGAFQLARSLDHAWQDEVLSLYDGVRQVLAAERGIDAFVIYGSLLGAVREGGFIGHDLDFDAAYLSEHTDPSKAADELKSLALLLIEHGFNVDCVRSALHIHAPSDPKIRIDLFHLYFDHEGLLRFPFGAAGTSEVRLADWRGVKERSFADSARVLAPLNAEQLVETIYGSGWREPNPGFSWRRDRRVQAVEALVPPEGVEEVARANAAARTR